MASILVVSKDPVVCHLSEQTLLRSGHEVLVAAGAEGAIHVGVTVKLDAAIIDETVLLPEVAESLAEWMRGRDPIVPVVILGGRDRVTTDDEAGRVLLRPLSAEAMRNAIHQAIKPGGHLPEQIHAGPFEIDRQRLEVRSNGERVALTPIQFRLIECLAEHHGGIVPTDELISNVWGDRRPDASPDLLRSHVYTLRERLRSVSREDLIENVPYRGYRLAS